MMNFDSVLNSSHADIKSMPRYYADLTELLNYSESESLFYVLRKIESCAPADELTKIKNAISDNLALETIESFLTDYMRDLQSHYRNWIAYHMDLKKPDDASHVFSTPNIEIYVTLKTLAVLEFERESKNCSEQTFESWKTVFLKRNVSEDAINRAIDWGQRYYDSFKAYA